MGHYISVEDIKPHYMKVLFFKNSQFWPVLIKIRETVQVKPVPPVTRAFKGQSPYRPADNR